MGSPKFSFLGLRCSSRALRVFALNFSQYSILKLRRDFHFITRQPSPSSINSQIPIHIDSKSFEEIILKVKVFGSGFLLKNRSMADTIDVNAKWDACLDLTLRRFVYSSLAGAFGGLLLFRSPVSRWSSIAFAAGVGVGSAYAECSHIFDGTPGKLSPPKVPQTSAPQEGQD